MAHMADPVLDTAAQMSSGTACLQKRGARIICEYLGGAVTCDAHHMTDPRADGLGVATCIEKALADSGARARSLTT
jgi:3-oxoacyl-(acyl-carrier-protein) synthase